MYWTYRHLGCGSGLRKNKLQNKKILLAAFLSFYPWFVVHESRSLKVLGKWCARQSFLAWA